MHLRPSIYRLYSQFTVTNFIRIFNCEVRDNFNILDLKFKLVGWSVYFQPNWNRVSYYNNSSL